jgi:hypothetical protein
MVQLHFPGDAMQAICAAAAGLPQGQARGVADMEPLVRGAERAVQAYTRASDAYAANFFEPSVALWALLIAGAVVLLEWLLARYRGR